MQIRFPVFFTFLFLFMSCNTGTNPELCPDLRISENKRFIITENGEPFFWMGDTGWLLFSKLNREEAEKFFEDRRQKGFNVIQVMVIHDVKKAVNVYGDSALVEQDIERPFTTAGNSADDREKYDYWDHVDYLVSLAHKKGLYLALVPLWGSNVRNGSISSDKAGKYVVNDYNKIPTRPTIDGEPSYEGIPQGLHDATQPYWTDSDVPRYAYWSVFAGACGFTYGNNAVMQFHTTPATAIQ